MVEFSVGVADELKNSTLIDDASGMELVALLHDVGKIKVPNEIINKPGKLNAGESGRSYETHTIEGRADAGTCKGYRPGFAV